MENEGLVRFSNDSGVVIERPGDTLDNRTAEFHPAFSMQPLSDDAALERATLLGCIFGLFVMASAGLVLFAAVHALITGHAF
jgi:hypothetical protein